MNVNVGARTKVSAIFHGLLLIVCVGLFPAYLNKIPLAALAAILLVTGFKLASPALFKQMWSQGRYQFLPFIITLVSIVFTDLLIGILIGLGVALLFILNSNLRRPVRRIVETHLGGDVLHIELANQVSFLNRASLLRVFQDAKPGTQMLIDATDTDYIDPDVLSMIRDFKRDIAPAHNVNVSLRGFRDKYNLHDELQFADYSTRELKDRVNADQVLEILREGNRRFRTGNRLTRDFSRQVCATATEQHPLAVVVSCIDSRVPAELVFDLGIGDMFSVRVAGNVIGTKSLGSIEYGVSQAGVKLVVVLGHTHSGAISYTLDLIRNGNNKQPSAGCPHLGSTVSEIDESLTDEDRRRVKTMSDEELVKFVDEVSARNVARTVREIVQRSEPIRRAVEAGDVIVVGALYDVRSGEIDFLPVQARAGQELALGG